MCSIGALYGEHSLCKSLVEGDNALHVPIVNVADILVTLPPNDIDSGETTYGTGEIGQQPGSGAGLKWLRNNNRKH